MHEFDDKTLERFWSKVNIAGPDDCWEWTALTCKKGYGQFKLYSQQANKKAHRVSFLFSKGDPKDLFVCHSCDNKSCCNPNHLWLGTNAENQQDAWKKGIVKRREGEDNPNAKLTEEDVRNIRGLIAEGYSNARIARMYNVGKKQIGRIKLGKAWKHI